MTQELQLYLEKLKSELVGMSDAALRMPNDRSEFGYGQASGRYLGLLRAEQLLTEAIEEIADEREK